ncbi:MAG: histidine phosphatase family protein [Pirellulales bacterium]|nr:histidine phosphatase family protein [Pirellulales bacterium]
MSTLYVVRHGQASFLADDYDQLSELGRSQSRLLGEFWCARGLTLDRIATGPRRRQIDTAELVAEQLRKSGRPVPEVEVLPDFDEYHAEAVLKVALPELIEKSAEVRKLQAEFLAATGRDEQLRTFQRMYEVVILGWAAGDFELTDVEPWPDFCDRVCRGLKQLATAASRGSRVAVFTSGGPVGVAMQHALTLSHEHTLRLAWMVRNASYSEFIFSGPRFTLSSFNTHPHLVGPELLTYR